MAGPLYPAARTLLPQTGRRRLTFVGSGRSGRGRWRLRSTRLSQERAIVPYFQLTGEGFDLVSRGGFQVRH